MFRETLTRLILLFVAILFSGADAAASTDSDIIRSKSGMTFVRMLDATGADRAAHRDDIADVEREGTQVGFVHCFTGRCSVSFPVSNDDLVAKVASYSRNLHTGNDRLVPACCLDPDRKHCSRDQGRWRGAAGLLPGGRIE